MFKRTDLKSQPVVFACSLVIMLSLVSAAAGDEDQDLPGPEKQRLKTTDGVVLVCDYYPGSNGKETVPILMVHGWEGVRGEFEKLATTLQRDFGHAVIVPDLRGHGDSVRYRKPNGEEGVIDPKRMNPRALLDGMYQFDLERVKKFLVRKNNEEELNIDLLCIVGAQMGAIVGMNWAVLDWSWPALTGIKQGQDVKAFVLVSPIQTFKGIKMQPALMHPNVRKLSTMILVGNKDRKGLKQARQLNSSMKRFHLPVPGDSEEKTGTKSLFLVDFRTSLKGTKLLDAPVSKKKFGPHDWIASFIQLRLQNKQDEYPWRERG